MTFEEEFERFRPVIKWLSDICLMGKKIKVKGNENFIRKGCNIIVGNHIGSFKDVATLLKIVPRPVFFTANREIFSREEFSHLISKHLRRHMKNIGLFMEVVLHPIKTTFVNYISTNIAKVGTIPVDLSQKTKLAVEKIQDYLKQGRAIIALQGYGRVRTDLSHPYVPPFKRGTAVIAYNLYQEGISVPFTPLAFHGTHFPYIVPKEIQVNVGEPMYISDYIGGSLEEVVEAFRSALEMRVKELFSELIGSTR